MLAIFGFFFALATLVYAFGILMCLYQERELSLPHEKAVRMNVIITALSLMLFALALYSFLGVNWNNLMVPRA